MSRSVPEWIGKSDDSVPPKAVFDRLWIKQGGKDAITGKPFVPADGRPHIDHVIPLADGGENRESNLQLIAIKTHRQKTAREAMARAEQRATMRAHRHYDLGRPSQWPKKPKAPRPKQGSATRPIKGKFPGDRMGAPSSQEI